MPIGDIVAEQAQRGEIDPELAAQAAGRRGAQVAQMGRNPAAQQRQQRPRRATPTLDNVTTLEKTDIQLWLDVAIIVMLFLIWTRL